MTQKGAKQVRRTPRERAERRRAYERGYRRKQAQEGCDITYGMPSSGKPWELIDELHKFIDEIFEDVVDENLVYEDRVRDVRSKLDVLEQEVGSCENVLTISPNPRCDLQTKHQIEDNWRFMWQESDKDPKQKDKPFTLYSIHYLDDLTSLIYKYFNHLDPVNLDHCPIWTRGQEEAKDLAVSTAGGILDFAKQLLAAAADRIKELQELRDELDTEPDYRYVRKRKK
ncbi:hypothetical protein ACFL02_01770 [Planctomycetota bacterium]